MGVLQDRIAIITGAGRGVGREHALLFAREGAGVVVNDLGGAADGSGADAGPAQQVVDEIKAAGGHAIANTDDISTSAGAKALIDAAVEEFGDLHVLVNNAGILRDRFLAQMTDDDWDDVISVHLRGHFAPTRAAAAYWKDRTKAGEQVRASVINTSSIAGLTGNPGQANYAAAKAGIAAFTVVAAKELERYGVRCNAIAPFARTRLTLNTPGLGAVMAEPEGDAFDLFNPANVSPLVAYLATEECPVTGGVFHILGGQIGLFRNWTMQGTIERGEAWTAEELPDALAQLIKEPRLASEGIGDAEMNATIMRAVAAGANQ